MRCIDEMNIFWGCNMTSFYTEEELKEIPFHSIGENVLISRKASIYSPEKIVIGNNVRIDDFCILSGTIVLGNFIHIAAYCGLYGGQAGIKIEDFANLSSRNCIYAVNDDYSGESMTNPMVPDEYKKVFSCPVHIEKHVIIGSGCTILPGVKIAEGTAIGAMSLCKKSTEAWSIYVGIPAKQVKERKRNILDMEKKFRDFCEINKNSTGRV